MTTEARAAVSSDDAAVRLVLDGLGLRDLNTAHRLIEAAKDWFADWIMHEDGDSPCLEAERALAKAVEKAMIR